MEEDGVVRKVDVCKYSEELAIHLLHHIGEMCWKLRGCNGSTVVSARVGR